MNFRELAENQSFFYSLFSLSVPADSS
jgi:hypothetical protein